MYKIFTMGFTIPGQEHLEYPTYHSLLEAYIIIVEPNFSYFLHKDLLLFAPKKEYEEISWVTFEEPSNNINKQINSWREKFFEFLSMDKTLIIFLKNYP